MYYIIQENLFREINYNNLIETMQRFKLPHQVVKIVPFTRDILFEPIDTKNVFCFGSVKMSHIAKDYGWTPGSFYNENHDYLAYSEKYGKENMLNGDSVICKFSDEFAPPGHLFFARPCGDTKAFTGQVFTKAAWDEFLQFHLTNGHESTLNKNTIVQIAKLKDIEQEIRTWVIKGEIATASKYKLGEKVIYQECNEPYILDFAKDMIKLYQPAEAFVMDVAVTENGMKIVEINCINSAGFYQGNLQKIIEKLEIAFTDES